MAKTVLPVTPAEKGEANRPSGTATVKRAVQSWRKNPTLENSIEITGR
jgi:hypothetical protein